MKNCAVYVPDLQEYASMMSNVHTGTTIDEVADGIYRINTPLKVDSIPGGFNLSQYLIVDEEPMVFHTGWRKWFPFVSEAITKVIPLERLRHVGYSHFEGDESGAMNNFAHSSMTSSILERLARLNPSTLACQHGSAYRGDGASLLRELKVILDREQRQALA